MADAENEFVVFENLRPELKIVIGSKFQCIAIGLSPLHKGQFPPAEL